MKTLTVIQAAVLLMLAVIGAYAGQDTTTPDCAKTAAAMESCDL